MLTRGTVRKVGLIEFGPLGLRQLSPIWRIESAGVDFGFPLQRPGVEASGSRPTVLLRFP